MRYFTADPHFGHTNIMRYCYHTRPFNTIQEMDAALMERWNDVVKEGDTVYVIGDFVCYTKHSVDFYASKLNGTIFIVPGGHDHLTPNTIICESATKEAVIVVDQIHVIKEGVPSKKRRTIVLCHYQMNSWPKSHFNSWHLHGHHHRKVGQVDGKIMNVGVDLWDFTPVSMLQVEDYMRTQGNNWDYVGDK